MMEELQCWSWLLSHSVEPSIHRLCLKPWPVVIQEWGAQEVPQQVMNWHGFMIRQSWRIEGSTVCVVVYWLLVNSWSCESRLSFAASDCPITYSYRQALASHHLGTTTWGMVGKEHHMWSAWNDKSNQLDPYWFTCNLRQITFVFNLFAYGFLITWITNLSNNHSKSIFPDRFGRGGSRAWNWASDLVITQQGTTFDIRNTTLWQMHLGYAYSERRSH